MGFVCFGVFLFVCYRGTYIFYSLYSNEEFKFLVDKICFFLLLCFLVPVNCLYCLKFRHHFTIPAIIYLAISFLGQFSSLFSLTFFLSNCGIPFKHFEECTFLMLLALFFNLHKKNQNNLYFITFFVALLESRLRRLFFLFNFCIYLF